MRRGEHHAALPDAEIGTSMAKLWQQEGIVARAQEFAILTWRRTGEVICTRCDEIDLAEQLRTAPDERMKAGNEHHVALSDAAMVMFEKMAAIRSGEFVSPGPSGDRPMSDMSMLTLLRRIGRDDLTVHGFRSAFSDWCAEQTYFVSEAHEKALAQAVDNSMEFAYCRNDLFLKRRQAPTFVDCRKNLRGGRDRTS